MTELLESANCAFDEIALAVDGVIKRPAMVFIASSWDGVAYATATQVSANTSGTIAFITHHTLRTNPRSPATGTLDGALFHEALEHR